MANKVTLTNDQFGELVQQFVEIQVDTWILKLWQNGLQMNSYFSMES